MEIWLKICSGMNVYDIMKYLNLKYENCCEIEIRRLVVEFIKDLKDIGFIDEIKL